MRILRLKEKKGHNTLFWCNQHLFVLHPLQITSNKNESKFSSRFIKFPVCSINFPGMKLNQISQAEWCQESPLKNKMEDCMAMKRMMRNPYEYHHDLGQVFFFACLTIYWVHEVLFSGIWKNFTGIVWLFFSEVQIICALRCSWSSIKCSLGE